MKVLRVAGGLDPRVGGPVQSTLLSTLGTVEVGVDVELIYAGVGEGEDGIVDRLRSAGVGVRRFPVRGGRAAERVSFSPALVWWLVRNLRRFDVVHAHGAWTVTAFCALLLARLRRIPYVLTPHESLTEHDVGKSSPAGRFVKRTIRQLYLRGAHAVVFASSLECDDSRGRGPVVAHPVEPVTRAVRCKTESEPLRVGFLGRFDPKKNLDLLLAALPGHAELLVAGDGTPAIRSALREVAEKAGVADRVTWLGFVEGDQKRGFFDALDVLAMPSRYECFGMAAAEALSAGIPVVVGTNTGIASIVARHDCGFVVEPDEGQLRAVLMRRDELRAKGARARLAAESELALDRHGRAVLDLYRSVARGNR